MKAKDLAEILLTKPESDVCIKREYVINPHGDTDYCMKGIKSIGIKERLATKLVVPDTMFAGLQESPLTDVTVAMMVRLK